jgi:polyferredoxin
VGIVGAVLLTLTVGLFTHMALRVPLKVDVLRDRGSLGREVQDGLIENVYRLQLMNTSETPRRLRIGVSGIETVFVASETRVEVDPAANRLLPVRVRVRPGFATPGVNGIEFLVEDLDDPDVAVREKSTFFVPR